jgi:hypothetical protein
MSYLLIQNPILSYARFVLFAVVYLALEYTYRFLYVLLFYHLKIKKKPMMSESTPYLVCTLLLSFLLLQKLQRWLHGLGFSLAQKAA